MQSKEPQNFLPFPPVETEHWQNLLALLPVNKPASVLFFQIFIDNRQQPSQAVGANRV